MSPRPPIATGLEPQVYVADWRARAACRDYPTELFFPTRGADRRSDEHRASIARSVCALCPVRLPCLMVALGHQPRGESGLPRASQLAGIWGGTNERERRALRQQIAAGRSIAEVAAGAPRPSSARHPSLSADERERESA